MRSICEASWSRVAIVAGGLTLLFSACGGGGGSGGTGGRKSDGGMGGQAGVKTDGGAGTGGAATDAGTGGRIDGGAGGAATDGGAGGQGDAATDGGAGGFALSLPWHAFLPLAAAAPGSGPANGTTNDVTANHYDATYFGTTLSFVNAALNLAGAAAELVLIPGKNGVPAVDVTGSYSVSVWATLANVGGYKTVVSGEGVNVASFYLQKRGDTNAWAFAVFPTDATGPGCVVPPVPTDGGAPANRVTPVVNTEYHLVATRDATTGTDVLYVNGVESGRGVCAGGWADTGIVGVGHGIYGGSRGDFVQGSLAELGLINRVLTPAEVADLFARGRTGAVRPDAGTDAGVDVPADVGVDAPVDTGVDVPAEVAPTDTGTDSAAADAATDLAADGG